MNIGKSIRKFRRNMRAISPVIATLLMIAIAVVASLVTYAWVMGYMNFTTEKTGKAIQIQSVSGPATGSDMFTIYVQNVGDSPVQFSTTPTVFINGIQANPAAITAGLTSGSLLKGDTATFQATALPALTHGVQSITIKITTLDGTPAEITKQFTIS